jgi:hypothetical protein
MSISPSKLRKILLYALTNLLHVDSITENNGKYNHDKKSKLKPQIQDHSRIWGY